MSSKARHLLSLHGLCCSEHPCSSLVQWGAACAAIWFLQSQARQLQISLPQSTEQAADVAADQIEADTLDPVADNMHGDPGDHDLTTAAVIDVTALETAMVAGCLVQALLTLTTTASLLKLAGVASPSC